MIKGANRRRFVQQQQRNDVGISSEIPYFYFRVFTTNQAFDRRSQRHEHTIFAPNSSHLLAIVCWGLSRRDNNEVSPHV